MKDFFAPVENEVSIPLDRKMHDFQFTRQWFRNRNQSTWSTFLKPLFHGQILNVVQIGVFEGYDLCWLMQNVLTHQNSTAIGIDPWKETTKLSTDYMNDVRLRAMHNLKPWADLSKVILVQGYSQDVLPSLTGSAYDLVIIDGDHTAPAVVVDAHEALRLLKVGGYMVFDDVRNRIPKADHVQAGLDTFLEEKGHRVELVWQHRYADCYRKV